MKVIFTFIEIIEDCPNSK